MASAEDFSEKQKTIRELIDNVAEIKAKLLIKETYLETQRQDMVDDLLEKINSLNVDVEDKSVNIINMEKEAVSKNAVFTSTVHQLESLIEEKDKLILELQAEIQEKKKRIDFLEEAVINTGEGEHVNYPFLKEEVKLNDIKEAELLEDSLDVKEEVVSKSDRRGEVWRDLFLQEDGNNNKEIELVRDEILPGEELIAKNAEGGETLSEPVLEEERVLNSTGTTPHTT